MRHQAVQGFSDQVDVERSNIHPNLPRVKVSKVSMVEGGDGGPAGDVFCKVYLVCHSQYVLVLSDMQLNYSETE